jgi:ubiquinone/menaquinone biosynthesis C-methylase UbiE
MFQLFDHIADPNSLLQECYEVLNDGGLMLCFNHNIDAFSSKVFKEKSPIIDIEHTYLYSKKTISKLFEKNKLKVLEVGSAWNLLNLAHITKLMPFPKNIKQNILRYFEANKKLGELNLTMPIGNLFIIAKKV